MDKLLSHFLFCLFPKNIFLEENSYKKWTNIWIIPEKKNTMMKIHMKNGQTIPEKNLTQNISMRNGQKFRPFLL